MRDSISFRNLLCVVNLSLIQTISTYSYPYYLPIVPRINNLIKVNCRSLTSNYFFLFQSLHLFVWVKQGDMNVIIMKLLIYFFQLNIQSPFKINFCILDKFILLYIYTTEPHQEKFIKNKDVISVRYPLFKWTESFCFCCLRKSEFTNIFGNWLTDFSLHRPCH